MARHITAEIIRSMRRSVSIQVLPDGSVRVKAPLTMSDRRIRELLIQKEDWILRQLKKLESSPVAAKDGDVFDEDELKQLAKQMKAILPQKLDTYAARVGVTYNKVSVRHQKTRWGSCSSKGNLNFNCLLMLAPEEILDYVIVHELCHRKEMNHSARFWAEVEKVLPDYAARRKWLKQNGAALMARLPD